MSEDGDFKLACDRYPSLLYFKSLPVLTELLLAPPEEIETLRAAVLADVGSLDESISDAARDLQVIHEDSDYEIDDTNIAGVSISDIRVVAVGHSECTLTFEAEVELENHLVWREWDDDHEEHSTENKWILETTLISGAVKVSLNPETHAIADVLLVSLDQDFLEVRENPRTRW